MNGSCRTRYIEYEARENKESRGNMEIKRGEKSEEGRGGLRISKERVQRIKLVLALLQERVLWPGLAKAS